MEESVINRNLDRLSELPQSLIHLILSLLPIRDVVSTTLLSKRWKNLWTTVPCLNFSGRVSKYELNKVERLRNFVNRTLSLWKGITILKFELTIKKIYDFSVTSDIDLWMRFVVENKVEELKIDFSDYDDDMLDWEDDLVMNSKKYIYWAPLCLNSCSSLRKLSLLGCNLQIHGPPLWNRLKSLIIGGFCFSESLINEILLGSPQLEVFELRLMESYENLSIQSTSLKRLKINKFSLLLVNEPLSSPYTVLKICCPNLETLMISGVPYFKCLFTDVSNVIDVTIDFIDYDYNDVFYGADELLRGTLRQIFSTIQHVEKIALSQWCVKVLFQSVKKYFFAPLPNVKFWKLGRRSIKYTEMMNVLVIFPNLETLQIEHVDFIWPANMEFDTDLSKSFLLQLKTVEIITWYFRYNDDLMQFLLKHAIKLEKLVLRVIVNTRSWYKVMFEISERLLRLPRSSPNAKVMIFRVN